MKSSVIIFPGSNCDRDMDVALKKFGFKNQMIWHNDNSIPKLKCEIVAGGANNQLAKEYIHDNLLLKHNILYAPDFLINAGGLINVYSELKDYSKEKVIKKTKTIFDTTLEIFKKADNEKISTQKAALKIAKNKIHKSYS